MLLFPSPREVFFLCLFLFLLFSHRVLTYVPLIAIWFNAAVASFARAPRFEASGDWGKSNGAESGDLKNWTQFGIAPNQAREHVVIAVSQLVLFFLWLPVPLLLP